MARPEAGVVDRSVHLSLRGLVEGVAPVQGAAVAAPAQRTQLGGFDVTLEAARDRILPGEENEMVIAWKAREGNARAKVQLFMEVPAELAAGGGGQTKQEEWGAAGAEGAARFVVTGSEPGGVWVEALLTFEDDMGNVLGRAKAGFSVARHRVVISSAEVEPPVVAAGGAFVVKARYAWTGQARVRGTLGGALRRREDGAELELFREKVSALGEREQEWRTRAPVDAAVADYDIELSFEGKETGARAQFGKTGALAVRRPREAEVVSVTPAKTKWGADAVEHVRAVVRNTGVETLEGDAMLEVHVRLPGAAEPVIVARAAEPEHAPLKIAPASSAEVAFDVKLPRGVEGRRVEGRLVATFGSTTAERREVLGHIVADHVLEFDGFAADRYAYGGGDEARVECRVRDDGARPGGRFQVAFRLLAGGKEVAASTAAVDMQGTSAPLVGVLALPKGLDAKGALDLEVAVVGAGGARRVEGFLRLRQPVATRVVVVKPAQAHARLAFLFDGEAVAEEVPLGTVEGAGEATLLVTDEPSVFFEAGGMPIADGPALERAAARAVAVQAGAPPPVLHGAEWERLTDSMARASGHGKKRATGAPSDLEERIALGTAMTAAGRTSGALTRAIELTDSALSGGRAPPAEVAAAWVEAAEKGAKVEKERAEGVARVARALATARGAEARRLSAWQAGAMDLAGMRATAEAAIWRRALEAELIAEAIDAGGHDRVLQLSAALKESEERLRDVVRYYAKGIALAHDIAKRAGREGADRRKLAALRSAVVTVKGAEAIAPGAYNEITIEVALPSKAPTGGKMEAAIALPSQLWIVASEGARLARGQYVLKAADVQPGGRTAWKLELFVPERVAAEGGAIEIRIGFEEGGA